MVASVVVIVSLVSLFTPERTELFVWLWFRYLWCIDVEFNEPIYLPGYNEKTLQY